MLTIMGILALLWLGSGILMMIELNKTPLFRSLRRQRKIAEKTSIRPESNPTTLSS